jgi:hypothetical protein
MWQAIAMLQIPSMSKCQVERWHQDVKLICLCQHMQALEKVFATAGEGAELP